QLRLLLSASRRGYSGILIHEELAESDHVGRPDEKLRELAEAAARVGGAVVDKRHQELVAEAQGIKDGLVAPLGLPWVEEGRLDELRQIRVLDAAAREELRLDELQARLGGGLGSRGH